MRKKIFYMVLLLTPLLFFFGLRLLRFVIGSETDESLKSEVIHALCCGYAVSLGLWFQYRRVKKMQLPRDSR